MSIAVSPRRVLILVAAVCTALVLGRAGLFRDIDNLLAEQRMAFAPRSAGGDIVFLGIDKRSLDRVGTWPWPRQVHAEIIRRLADMGAAEIYLDVDFSAPSNPDADAALERALAASPTAVVLPVLLQDAAIGAGASLERSLPLPMFRDRAWLASVNVRPDADGVIRRFPYGQELEGGGSAPSIPAMLAGVLGPAGSDFAIDFSIRPETIPAHSVADLLEGELQPDAIRGKSVVMGAYAIELRDNFNVPVHRVLTGSLIQSSRRKRSPRTASRTTSTSSPSPLRPRPSWC